MKKHPQQPEVIDFGDKEIIIRKGNQHYRSITVLKGKLDASKHPWVKKYQKQLARSV